MPGSGGFPWWTGLRFVAGAALVIAAAWGVSESVDPVYPVLRAQVADLRDRRAEVEAVSVGNSHSRALDFRALGITGAHLWRSGQDPFESGYLARIAAEEAPGLRLVFLTASYGMQRMDHGVVGRRDLTDRRRELYARTPLRRPLPGDRRQWVAGRLSPVARPDHWEGVVARFGAGPRARLLDDDGRPWEPPTGPLSEDSLARHGAFRAAAHREDGAEIIALAPGTPRRVAAELDALAKVLRRRGVTLVLYTPPYHASYLRGQDPEVLAEAREVFAHVLAGNPNAVWMDFSRHPSFQDAPALFTNSDHLSPEGARRFSALLRRCLDALSAAPHPGCPVPERPVPSARADRAGNAYPDG